MSKKPIRLTSKTLKEEGDKFFQTTSKEADVQTQIDGKQPAGTYLTSANIEDTIVNGVTTKAPSQNAVFDSLALKQDTLVSGTNIKTINGNSVLGSGDLTITSSDPLYAYGSFTVATGTYKVLGMRLKLTSTQRATLQGTGRLRIQN